MVVVGALNAGTLGEVLMVEYEASAVEIIGSVTDTTLVFDDGSLEETSR